MCALVPGGGYAGYVAAPAGTCMPIPTGLSMVEAAALPETFCTVWTNVFQKGVRGGELVPGDTLLVHGGSSGIGTTAIQLAKSRGSDVIVTAVTQTKCNACLELGANAAVNYREESEGWFAAVKEATGGQGVDVVLDMVGGPYLAQNLALLKHGESVFWFSPLK